MNGPIDSVIAWGLGICLLLIIGLMVAYADEPPPQTTIKVCGGPLPSLSLDGGAESGCLDIHINETDPTHPQYIGHCQTCFRHIYYEAGDDACVGTGPYPIHGRFGSGRDLNRNDTQHVAYIAEGWAVFGVTGQGCDEAGIGNCHGDFCR